MIDGESEGGDCKVKKYTV